MGKFIKNPRYRVGTSIGGIGLGVSFGLGGCNQAGADPTYTAPLGHWEFGASPTQGSVAPAPMPARSLEQYLPVAPQDVLGWLWAHMPWDVVLQLLGTPFLPGRG